MDRLVDVPGRTLIRGCLPVFVIQLFAILSCGPRVEAECVIRLYYNLSAEVPSYVDQTCEIACCGHYPNVYCCDQCDSTFRNADGHLGSGAVTGIVLGILIGLVILFVIFVYVYGRWRRDKDPVGRAMYRLYRMSTRRRRRPKPQTGQDGQTSPNGPSTIQVPNGGTQNRAFSDDQGNYPRSRRRTPRTTETPMTEEQLSKPPRPGHLVPRRTDKNPTPSSEGTVQGNPPPKYGQLDPPQSQSYKDSTPSAPPLELNTFRLENQSNTNYKHLPQSGGAQGYDNTKPYISHNDKQYEALGKRQDEHPYTTPQNGNQRDRYGMQRDRGDREKLPSESRLGPPAKPHQYGGESKTSHPLDGHIQQPPSRNLPYQSDKQTSKPPNRYTSQPPHSSDKNTAHQQDRQTSHPPNRDTSYPSQPTNRNTSYPSDRHTSHSSDQQAAYQNVNNDTQYRREPRPTYPPTNEGRGGPGYPTYSSTPDRGGATRQPQYKDMPIGQRDYRPADDNRGVILGKSGGPRQSQI